MRILGVIPSRWGSTRFPGKSLHPILGKPLIVWVVEAVKRARSLDAVIVATDDERIAEAVGGQGIRVAMTSPHHPSGTDRVAEAAGKYRAEIIVNIQGDEPAIDPNLIDRLAGAMLREKKWDMATAASPLKSAAEAAAPSICKVVFSAAGQALYFSRHPIPFIREKSFAPPGTVFWRHIGIYLYRRKFLARFVAEPPCLIEKAECLEQLRALHIGARIKVEQADHAGIGVDTPADIAAAEEALKLVKRGARSAARLNYGEIRCTLHE